MWFKNKVSEFLENVRLYRYVLFPKVLPSVKEQEFLKKQRLRRIILLSMKKVNS
jgi:hypothetical protein